jgi:hypothetical protein
LNRFAPGSLVGGDGRNLRFDGATFYSEVDAKETANGAVGHLMGGSERMKFENARAVDFFMRTRRSVA